MKLALVLTVLTVAALGFGLTGCRSTSTADGVVSGPSLCGGCGHLKGDEACCAADAAKCACGLAKGSPGCCKMEAGKDAALCTGCGMIKGGEGCCDADAAHCGSCDLIKGSPGCCKLE